MAYRKSKARRDFEIEITSILRVVGKPPPRQAMAGPYEYVLSCGILLTSAQIEQYIEDIFTLIADAISQAPIQAAALPNSLRAYLFALDKQLVASFKHYIAFQDERRLIKNVTAFFSNRYSALAHAPAKIPLIDGSRLIEDCKYPSPENIRALFARLGIHIFAELNRRASRDVELDIRSFNSVRSSLAHSGLGTDLTVADIRRHIKRMKEVIALIDRVCFAVTCKIVGQAAWLKKICTPTI